MPAILTSPDQPCIFADVTAAARCARAGGALIFPTETFYALGCLAACPRAVEHIYQLKRRPVQWPLPLLAGEPAQVAAVARLEEAPARLLERFWPGPLTLLLSVREEAASSLAPALINAQGKIAVRVSSHPLARQLALEAGGLLTSSSANISRRPPAQQLAALDAELLAALAQLPRPEGTSSDRQPAGGILPARLPEEYPAGGKPSSLVEMLDATHLRLLRAGAIDAASLQDAGYGLQD